MKKWILISALIASTAGQYFAQTSDKKTIAVAMPFVNNLTASQETVSKMIRLELIKLNTYNVYDEFDMQEVIKTNEAFQNECFGQTCLITMGEQLNTDYILFGSVEGLSNRIVVSIKLIDIKNKTLLNSKVREFDDQEHELQRMIEIVLKELTNVSVDKELVSRLEYQNEPITSSNVGRINNSGPRIGLGYMLGSVNEFAIRSENQGGLGIKPIVSMIGYQFEEQYVGTDIFSALIECIVNVSGIEQGRFIPTFTILNGFRFGKAGWEFAFGPGIGLKKVSNGFFDTDNKFGGGYFSESDWSTYAYNTYSNDPAFQTNGYYVPPKPSDIHAPYSFAKHGDTRGSLKFNTTFVFALGRTFHAGALNIPVNLFYSSQKGGGITGLSVGFNIQKSKTLINE